MSSIYDEPPLNPQPLPEPQAPAPFYGSAGPTTAYSRPTMQSGPEQPQKKSGCGCIGCLLGCLGVVSVLVVMGGFGTWWGLRKLPDWTRGAIDQVVQESDLAPEDKQMVMKQVDRLVEGYKEGKVDLEKLGQFAQRFAESPLMDLMIAYAAKIKYIDPSGLTDEEKAEADKTLQRVARGVVEEKIPKEKLDVALNQISNEIPNGGRQFREDVSDAELRAFLAECKKLADEAAIPEGEFKVDIGDELRKLVDETLGETDEPVEPKAAVGPPKPVAPSAPSEPKAPVTVGPGTRRPTSQRAADTRPTVAGQRFGQRF